MPPVPRHLLSEDAHIRAEYLEQYFADLLVSSSLTQEGWSLTLSRPNTADYYIDPRILDGLQWWSNDNNVRRIPFEVQREPGFQLSLNDSWTLYAWSCWLTTHASRSGMLDEVVILHNR